MTRRPSGAPQTYYSHTCRCPDIAAADVLRTARAAEPKWRLRLFPLAQPCASLASSSVGIGRSGLVSVVRVR